MICSSKDGEFRRVQVKYRFIECYYLRPENFGSTASLRVRAPKNGQLKKINFAADYRRVP